MKGFLLQPSRKYCAVESAQKRAVDMYWHSTDLQGNGRKRKVILKHTMRSSQVRRSHTPLLTTVAQHPEPLLTMTMTVTMPQWQSRERSSEKSSRTARLKKTVATIMYSWAETQTGWDFWRYTIRSYHSVYSRVGQDFLQLSNWSTHQTTFVNRKNNRSKPTFIFCFFEKYGPTWNWHQNVFKWK